MFDSGVIWLEEIGCKSLRTTMLPSWNSLVVHLNSNFRYDKYISSSEGEGKLLFFRYEGVIQRVVGKVKYKNRAKHTLIDKQ